MEALHEAIKLAGGTQGALAEAITHQTPDDPVGQSAISNWLQRGKVPAERVLHVAIATEFKVTPHAIRPDLYPNPDDGLPMERRATPEERRAAA